MTKYVLEQLMSAGAHKASAEINRTTKYEMNVENGDMSLIRTTQDVSVSMIAIKDDKKGSVVVNRTDDSSIIDASRDAVSYAEVAQPDSANDIPPFAPSESFTDGSLVPDRDGMYSRLNEFLLQARHEYPKTALDSVYFSFNCHNSNYFNSNDVDFSVSRGYYSMSIMGMGVDGEKTGSFNGTGFTSFDLSRPIMESASVRDMLRMCTEQIDTKALGSVFDGDVIFSPDCFDEILTAYIDTYLSENSLIAGTSLLKDKLGDEVASKLLTVRSMPADNNLSGGYRVFGGFKAENETILDSGVLKAYDLSLYGSNKTGLPRSKSGFGAICVDAGKTPYEDMVRSIKRGLLVCRFSGGNPTSAGDLSGVAKNSYYIEDGVIKFPVNETMIAGNLLKMFTNIGAVSCERTDFGAGILPYVLIRDIKITG